MTMPWQGHNSGPLPKSILVKEFAYLSIPKLNLIPSGSRDCLGWVKDKTVKRLK